MFEAWHFVGETLRGGSPIPADGVTLKHDGKLELCKSGLHASKRIIDALQYAPGNTICRVKCGGRIVTGNDKLVCSERTILWRVDSETPLRDFARQCALDMAHLWDMPEIVRRYLETGDESIREASGAAAREAAREAAWEAAWEAAREAAWAAACAAAREAARTAVWAAARAAACAAARAAAREAQNARLEAIVTKARII